METNQGEDGESYNIFYAKDFNRNGMEYLYDIKGVTKETIPSPLIELSHEYYDELTLKKRENWQRTNTCSKKPSKITNVPPALPTMMNNWETLATDFQSALLSYHSQPITVARYVKAPSPHSKKTKHETPHPQ